MAAIETGDPKARIRQGTAAHWTSTLAESSDAAATAQDPKDKKAADDELEELEKATTAARQKSKGA